jgi:hypothetical protein
VSKFKSALLAGTAALSLAIPAAAHAQIAINVEEFQDGGLFLGTNFSATGFADPSAVCGTDVGCQEAESTVYIHFDVSGIATATCTPPGNGSGSRQVVLRSPIPETAAGVVGGSFQNFTPPNATPGIGVETTTSPPTNLTVAGAPDCPNSRWLEKITDIAFTSATISLRQGTTTALATAQMTCTFNPPTANGNVPPNSYASASCVYVP